MKVLDYIIFISIVLLVYGSLHFYLFIRGWEALPDIGYVKIIYSILFSIGAASYILGRIIENASVCSASTIFIWIGSFWLGLILYLFLFIVFFDVVRLFNYLFDFYPLIITDNYNNVKFIAFFVTLFISISTVIAGHINTLFPRTKEVNISINKEAGKLDSLNIVLATDIHLGTIISNSRVDYLVKIINSCNPDIVLLGGDIVDEDIKPVIKNNLGEKLKKIIAKYGIYAITGNHEFIGGVNEASKYLSDHNITVLRDATIKIDESFYLIGREDRTINRFKGAIRKSIKMLLQGVDQSLPIITMDHQPFGLEESAANGIDLQLSGHTHHGQLWPLNFIVNRIFEVSSGYKKIKDTHFYVSNGYGTWGPPIRTGNRPEIVNLKLNFNKKN